MARRRASRQQVQIIGANKVSEYFGPVGTMCVNAWHVATPDGHHLHVTGLLEFTNAGSALVWTDARAKRLALGLARHQWGSITVDDND
jgi:hypothetical protein